MLLDAFVVRVIVAPALIALIGDRYWWMPRGLEWLPWIDIEGPAPTESHATPGAQRPARRDAVPEVEGGEP